MPCLHQAKYTSVRDETKQLTWICGRQPWGVSDGQYQWCSFSWPLRSSCLQNKDMCITDLSFSYTFLIPFADIPTDTEHPLMILNTNEKFSIKNGIHTLSLALLRVPALATWGLLEVVSLGPTTTAQSVRLVPALTKRWRSLGLTRNRKQWN